MWTRGLVWAVAVVVGGDRLLAAAGAGHALSALSDSVSSSPRARVRWRIGWAAPSTATCKASVFDQQERQVASNQVAE